MLGVAEQVQLTSDGDSWSLLGPGSLDVTSGNTVLFTAPEIPGTTTVTASGRGCLSASVTYTVIAPSGLFYQPVNGIKHTMGLADIGMQAGIYLQPDTVSFKRIGLIELDVQAVASGPYSCLNGTGHHPNPVPVFAAGDDVVGLGTPVATDSVYSGSCSGNQFADGSIIFDIPEQYVAGVGGAQYAISSVRHVATAAASGALRIQKGTAARSATVNSPTSTF